MKKYSESRGGKLMGSVLVEGDVVSARNRLDCCDSFVWISMSAWRALFLEIFLPRGYPKSVSADYLSYQVWDTLQAFASSFIAALATEAVLKGAGVGDKDASALAAALTWIIKDGFGMMSRIFFAWFTTASLDANCKQWRLLADALNDLAFSLDLVAPNFPNMFSIIACFSSATRAIVGVAGGATRTTIILHQAKYNNIADVAAKDGSQETLVNVTALIFSLIILPLVSGRSTLTWSLYFLFTTIHLYANYRAVKALQFSTLNSAMISIIARHFHECGEICSIADVNRAEPLMLNDLPIRRYGCRLSDVLSTKCSVKTMCTNCVIAFDHLHDHSFVAVTSGLDCHMELRIAFQLEFVRWTGKIVSDEQLNNIFMQLDGMGWKIREHRLSFDSWTFEEK